MSTNILASLKSGSIRSLVAAFIYFDVSFMIWVLFGPLANYISSDFSLSASQKGLLVGIPLLGTALVWIPMGILTDRSVRHSKVANATAIAIVQPATLVHFFFRSSLIARRAPHGNPDNIGPQFSLQPGRHPFRVNRPRIHEKQRREFFYLVGWERHRQRNIPIVRRFCP